jgi:type IV secretion system protein TrbB
VERDVTTISSFRSEAIARGTRMLRTALGPMIAAHLEDPGIVEIMLNPDGRLWIDRLSGGLEDTGSRIAPADAERIVRLVAHHVGVEVHAGIPRVSAELPESGERFEGLVPPVVAAPCFAIRRPAIAVFSLDHYVQAGIMSGAEANLLRRAVQDRQNILIAGGTSTGKTTLVNALLAEVAKTGDRIVLIEDTRELQCAAPNLVALRTKDGTATLSDLVRSALRLRPDRIPIGEVRGAEALDLLKAWGTGHPGGVGTLHAGSALGALRRLEQLIQEAVVTVPRALIAETVEVIAVLAGRGAARRLTDLAAVMLIVDEQPGIAEDCHQSSIALTADQRHELTAWPAGSVTYYSHFYSTRLRPTLKRIDAYVIRWARRKFKRMVHQTKGARDWFDRLRRTTPQLFAHWPLCHGNGRTSGAV